MAVRPVDIARKLGISTTTLRKYEELGLIPPVSRSASGYRIFTEEHIAYFICIREMMAGFTLARISKIMKYVIAKKTDTALWLANKAQAELRQEKIISDKIMRNLLNRNNQPTDINRELLTINDVSRETGVPAATIRHWDKVGLISAIRCPKNNYRMFTAEHIRQILTIYALKLSVDFNSHNYSIDRVREELREFDYNDKDRIITIANDIKQHLTRANRAQISSICSLYRLCMRVEENRFDNQL